MLEVQGLRKSFGAAVAVADVSFRVGPGETLGLLGPNGAGKTTTVSMIVGALRPDGGRVLIDGAALRGDTDPAKRKLGLVPQDLALHEELSGLGNLRFFGALYRLEGRVLERAIDEALTLVDLRDRASGRVRDYSGGMKRRLNLAAALLHDPPILLLDEPTVGVDPQSRNAIFDNLEQLAAAGKAIVYTTHYMEEAERLCDRIVIVDHGRVIADDTVRGLFRRAPAEHRLVIEMEDAAEAAWVEELRTNPSVRTLALRDGVLSLDLADLVADAPVVLGWLAARGLRYHHVASARPDLEAVFLSLTGRSLRDP